ncbi:MAG: hypothetical protein GQE15_16655, partial [Archangiaceae bacterium]|nr:hypothetical protein [Archangiaceae bacterium]
MRYEYRQPNPGLTDWESNPSIGDAADVLVISIRGTTLIHATSTSTTGDYTVRVPTPYAAGDQIFFLPVGTDGQGSLLYGVGNPGLAASAIDVPTTFVGNNTTIWTWAIPSNAATSRTITETEGSGALHIFRSLRLSYEFSRQFFGQRGRSLVAWFSPGTTWSCGACFNTWPRAAGGFMFDQQVWIGGGTSQGNYSDAVNFHEFGHWIMAGYGTPAVEGGTHFMGIPTFPGQAWSEGFATWFSSVARSSPIYYDKQGNFIWLNIGQRNYYDSRTWQRPQPVGGLLQKMDENEVSSTLWSVSLAAPDGAARVLWALNSRQMLTRPFGRGYTQTLWQVGSGGTHYNVSSTSNPAPTIADELDALVCEG